MQKKAHPYEKLQIGLANLIAQTAAGERLPTEPLLAQKLGVSRATLREAMRSFESQGSHPSPPGDWYICGRQAPGH